MTDLKAIPEAAFLRDAPSHCLQAALKDLDAAYDRFFKGLASYPRPRRRGENDAFTFPDPAQIRVDVKAGALILPKFGRRRGDGGAARAIFHRRPYRDVRRVTIAREGRGWYASILVRIKSRVPPLPQPTSADVIGIDRGVSAPLVTSGRQSFGAAVEGARERRKQRRLAKALSRTKHGSKRREKARLRLLSHKSKMARRRRDQIHKITTKIAKNHRIVVIEQLRV